MSKTRVATAVARLLEKLGTEYVFGYNGHGNWPLLDAMVHESNLRIIRTRSEDHAAHMADCYWRMRRTPPLGIVCVTCGPGAMNVSPAIAQAFYDSSALLVIAGGVPTQWYDRGCLQEFYRYSPEAWTNMVRPITKKSILVNRPDTCLEMLIRAYKDAISGRPGPVVVQIPLDIQNTEIEVNEIPENIHKWVEIHPPSPDSNAIKESCQIIQKSRAPLLVVSSGIHNAQAWGELKYFSEEFQIPVVNTLMGKGALREDHPMSLGGVGRFGTLQAINAAQNCDVLIAIGTRFNDKDTSGWKLYNIPRKTKLIHIDIDPTEINRVYPSEVAIFSDAKAALKSLAQGLKAIGFSPDHSSWLKRLDTWKNEWESKITPLKEDPSSPMNYSRVVSEASLVVNEIDPATSVLFDTGNINNNGLQFFKSCSQFVSSNGNQFSRMGWSVPGIIGAKLGNPKHPAIAFLGDGSFIMTGFAVATAKEYRIPVCWVIVNNKSLQTERESMKQVFGRHALCDYMIEKSGELWNPDFVKFAESMGVEGIRVDEPSKLKPAFEHAMRTKDPLVIDTTISIDAKRFSVSPPFSYPWEFSMRGLDLPPF